MFSNQYYVQTWFDTIWTLWVPKLMCPNSEQDVASIFTEVQLSPGIKWPLWTGKGQSILYHIFVVRTLKVTIIVNKYHVVSLSCLSFSMLLNCKINFQTLKSYALFWAIDLYNVIIPINQKSNNLFIYEIKYGNIKVKMEHNKNTSRKEFSFPSTVCWLQCETKKRKLDFLIVAIYSWSMRCLN